ncbi:MAG: FAD:protein FMN transferase [Pseudohongiellaceae bacterium]
MNITALRRFPFQAMGSFCEIQLLDKSRIDARQRFRLLAAEVVRLEQKFSRYRSDSLVAGINASAGRDSGIEIDEETASLFRHASSCYEQSNGLFDITSGVLRKIWDFKSGTVPTRSQIAELLPLVGMEKLELRENQLFMPAGFEIDFGGIVKEYAADTAAALARNLGIESGLINLGGDFSVIGPLPGDRPWPVGIVNPSKTENLMARLQLQRGGLASSGDYERFFMHEGKRYSHIINPMTGWPSDGLRAVSVCAELCTVAGSAATIAMLKTENDAVEWLAQLGLPHVFMRQDETIGGTALTTDNPESRTSKQPDSSQ